MTKCEAIEWLQEHNCYIGEHDGNPFVIVELQCEDPAADPFFFLALDALEEDNMDYGYGDEYTTCSSCCEIIRTSPTHATWTPDYWLNLRDGEIFCKECTKLNANLYFAWLAEEATEDTPQICLLDPEEHGFTKVIEDLEYGLHPGQNDDPEKLIAWANENHYEIAFIVRQNPFTATFDVWLRGTVILRSEETPSIGTYELVRAPIDTKQIRKTLLVPDSQYSHLRTQFREWPTPEEQCKRASEEE